MPPSTPRQQLERAIADNPAAIENYLALADLFAEEDNHGEVEQVLTKALQASGGELKVRERLEDAQIARARHQLAAAEKRAAAEQTVEAKSLVERLCDELNRREIDLYATRSERYPDELHLQYELALRLKRAGNYAEAAKQFRGACQLVEVKADATLQLGECLQHMRQFDKSLECYSQAVKLAADDAERKKLALYRAGVLAAGMRQWDQAQQWLEKLLEIDPDFKDAGARLDKIKQIRHKS